MGDFKEAGHFKTAQKLLAKVESVAINSAFSPVPSTSAWSVSQAPNYGDASIGNMDVRLDGQSTSPPDSSTKDQFEYGTIDRDISLSPPTNWRPSPLGDFAREPHLQDSYDPEVDANDSRIPVLKDSPKSKSPLDESASTGKETEKSSKEDQILEDSGPGDAYESTSSCASSQPIHIHSISSKPEAAGTPTTYGATNLAGQNAVNPPPQHDIDLHQSKGARSEYFTRVETFLTQLNDLSESLRSEPIEKRNDVLRMKLRLMNAYLPAAVYVPLFTGDDFHHAVLRIPAEEAFVLKSKERVPFMLVFEVLESNNKNSEPDFFLPNLHRQTLTSTADNPLVKYAGPFGELKSDRENRLKSFSPYGHMPKWNTFCCIVKSGDDLRQDQFALQLIEQFQRIFENANIPLWLYPYRTLVTSSASGFIEVVPDAISIDSLKKKTIGFKSLLQYFQTAYNESDPRQKTTLYQAQQNFVESMAAYSLVCYFLQIKDRHNGNILLNYTGHIIHIDFGFMLSNSPGSMNFESAPFKLTQEFVDVMGGKESGLFMRFRNLFVKGFLESRRHMDKLVLLVDMMMSMSHLPCFKAGKATIDQMLKRFCPTMTEDECVKHINTLIDDSIDAWSTRQYDNFQYLTNGIL
eukprot:TRINITY_DN1022_c0_g2_i10.p1 TRINITY_DN1022_c0_g2~~TRINITY_DN1022_c0_g2_i10.p1  ORF type:complete len:671 (+),score=114.97 TRINITY_DN1022_c0_g2_i10:113-2014(+)